MINVTLFIFTAKDKLKLHRKHVTSGGKAPPDFTENDTNILRIIGESPVYIGVRDGTFDTGVERTVMNCTTGNSVKGSLKTSLLPATSEMVEALNTGTFTL